MRTLTILIVLTASLNYVFPQEKIPPQYNFEEIQRKNQEYIKLVKERRDTTDKTEKYITRWENFWTNRLDKNKDIRSYSRVMNKHFKGKKCASDCTNCCFLSNWQYLGPKVENQSLGKVSAVWVHPSNNGFILLGAEGGLWKTVDYGENWECISDFCFPGVGITHIDVNYMNNDEIYVSTGITSGDFSMTDHRYGYGVMYSHNGGMSWSDPFFSFEPDPGKKYSNKVIVHPSDPNVIYAIVGNKVVKSVNKGINWSTLFSIPNDLPTHDLALAVLPSSDEIYVSTSSKIKCWSSGTGSCIVGPDTFEWGCSMIQYNGKVYSFQVSGMTISGLQDLSDPASPILPGYNPITMLSTFSIAAGTINIACQTNWDACSSIPAKMQIYRKPLTGGSWSQISNYTWQSGILHGMKYGGDCPFFVSNVDPDVMYLGGNFIHKSVDGGTTFSIAEPGYWTWLSNPNFEGSHPDIRCMLLYSSSSGGTNDHLFFGTDGGLSESKDGMTTTQNLNGDGLQLTQFFGFGNSEQLPNLICGGTQDNGYFSNMNPFWFNDPEGDAYRVDIDKSDPHVGYTTKNWGNSVRKAYSYHDGTISMSYIGCPPSGNCNGETELYITENNELFVATNKLWKYDGSSWQDMSPTISTTQKASALEISDDGNYAVLGFPGPTWGEPVFNKLFLISNLLTTPVVTDISIGLNGVQWKGITGVAFNNDLSKIYVCLGNLSGNNKQVCKYENGAWVDYGQGLPAIPANDIEFYKGGSEILFLAMDDGVYYRDNSMNEWKRFSCQLPKTLVSDLEINYDLLKLRASTYSRGIWESNLPILEHESTCKNTYDISSKINANLFFNYEISVGNNQIIDIPFRRAAIDVSIKDDYCQGCTCCVSLESVSWKIKKDGAYYSSGNSLPVSFNGSFVTRTGWWIWENEEYHTYEVEITPTCNNVDCSPIYLIYRGVD